MFLCFAFKLSSSDAFFDSSSEDSESSDSNSLFNISNNDKISAL